MEGAEGRWGPGLGGERGRRENCSQDQKGGRKGGEKEERTTRL